MPALHAAATPLTLSNVDVERANDRPDGREVFLVLRCDGRFHHWSRTVRTHGGQRRVVPLVDVQGYGAVCRPSIRGARLAPGTSRVGRGPILRERRRLPTASAPRRFELPAQSFVIAPQSFDLSPQRLALALGALGAIAQGVDLRMRWRRLITRRIRHADVMPDLRQRYKYEILDRLFSALDREDRTR